MLPIQGRSLFSIAGRAGALNLRRPQLSCSPQLPRCFWDVPDDLAHMFVAVVAATCFSLAPDFSGQKWTLRKQPGGQNGWGASADEILILRVNLWR